MRKKSYVLCSLIVVGLLVAVSADTIMALQRFQQPQTPGAPPPPGPQQGPPQGGRYAPGTAQAPQQQGTQPQANGPLSLILGPVGDVAEVKRGNPLAPGTDTYYTELPIEEWVPDEFISNPDREFDWRQLKGWHYSPLVEKVTILGNRKIKAGESVRFEALVVDVTGTQGRMSMSYFGPQGRRSTLQASLAPVTPGSNVLRGEVRTNRWAEPGVYRLTYVSPDNELQHGKIYHSDHHAGLKGLEFEVLPNPEADVIPPTIDWVKVNTLDAPEGQIRTQRVGDPIPVFAKVTDNKSGVNNVTVRFITPAQHFIEARLNKVIGQNDVYGAMLSVPEWWEGGEYKLVSFWARDNADKTNYVFQTTHPVLKNAKVIMQQDPAKIDTTPPTLFSVWLDKERARLGERIQVNVVMTDDRSGVGTIAVNFAPYPSYIDRVRVHLRPVDKPAVIQKSGFDISANLWTGTFDINPWFEEGEWRIDRITARDNADNYLDVLPEYNPELDVKITLTGGINLREQMINQKKATVAPTSGRSGGDMAATPAPAAQPAQPAAAAPAAPAAGATGQPGKIRRVDMVPPHPPRGACLNCHEP